MNEIELPERLTDFIFRFSMANLHLTGAKVQGPLYMYKGGVSP
jgi:hypothetical protein